MTDRELMQMALDGLCLVNESELWRTQREAAQALRDRLAQPEPETVAWMVKFQDSNKVWQLQLLPHRVHPESPLAKNALNLTEQPLYTAPPKREWKGLTSDDKHFLLANAWNKEQAFDGFMDSIDKFLEEKNT